MTDHVPGPTRVYSTTPGNLAGFDLESSVETIHAFVLADAPAGECSK
jgi:hypothetical protein